MNRASNLYKKPRKESVHLMSKIKKSISPGLETVRLSYENNFMIEKCDLAEHMQIS